MANLDSALSVLAQRLRDFYGEQRYRALMLYGSYARGEAEEGSDVDLLLVLAGEVRPTAEIRRISAVMWPLALELGYLLAVFSVGEKECRSSARPFLANVRREAVTVTPSVDR